MVGASGAISGVMGAYVLLALATISRDRGALDAAGVYARKLVELTPEDPGARELLRQLDASRR